MDIELLSVVICVGKYTLSHRLWHTGRAKGHSKSSGCKRSGETETDGRWKGWEGWWRWANTQTGQNPLISNGNAG